MLWLTIERRKKGWTQAELAKRAGLNQVTLCRLEREMMKPFPGWKKKLAEALGVDPEILFSEVKSYSEE